MSRYPYFSHTVFSADPRMHAALREGLGLYEFNYWLARALKRPPANKATQERMEVLTAGHVLDRPLLEAWVKKFKLEERLTQMEREAAEAGPRRG